MCGEEREVVALNAGVATYLVSRHGLITGIPARALRVLFPGSRIAEGFGAFGNSFSLSGSSLGLCRVF